MLYAYALAYLVAPETFSSAQIIEFLVGVPEGLKYAGKAILAAPFAFHSLNGIRHLTWDMTKRAWTTVFRYSHDVDLLSSSHIVVTVKGAYSSGYAVLAATGLATVGLLML